MSTDVDKDNSFTFGNVRVIVKGDKVILMSIEIEEAQSFDFGDLSSIEGEANDVAAVDVDDYL